jgi:hypothetical protein
MPLDGNPHGGKEPTVIPLTTQPTVRQREDVLHHAWPRFHRLSSRLAPSAVLGSVQDVDHVLALLGMVPVVPRCGPQGHPALALELAQPILSIGCAVHHHRFDHASQVPSCPPQACGFMSAVAPVLEGPPQTRAM